VKKLKSQWGKQMTKEALRLAIKALKSIDEAMPFPVAKLAIKECKAALEAPQRTWVGLTEDEAIELLPEGDWEIESTLDFARAIETKLRSKNT